MRAFQFLLGALLCLVAFEARAATTLLPPGMQCFTDANGAVSAGSVYMYYPSTTTPKPTWQDSNQVTLNSQPIVLDSNGCATIYGVGAYRQELFDSNGSLLFDKITTDTSAYNSVFWAGLAAGTPNVITVVDTGFNGTDGAVINFTALATNTGSVTINPSGFGAISVVKDTSNGPIPLTGGEIIASNVISVVYSASGNNFHLINTAIASASGNTAPLCGASNLKITNNSSTPSTIITVTADVALMTTTNGVVINRGTISQNINITTGTVTSTAGGMDGEAVGTSAWLYLWLIDNGSAPAALASAASGNGLTPNMPSGYTFKCRVGAMRVDGSSNLLRTLQRGITAQYTLISPSNTQVYPSIGTTGSASFVALSTSNVVPPTASTIKTVSTDTSISQVALSPNSVPSTTGTTTPPACLLLSGASQGALTCEILLESTNIYAATNAATLSVFAVGWKDQVNAN